MRRTLDIIGARLADGNPHPVIKERLGLTHLSHMYERVTGKGRLDKDPAGEFSEGKLGRWLGWMQCAAYARGLMEAEELEELNRGFAGGPPTELDVIKAALKRAGLKVSDNGWLVSADESEGDRCGFCGILYEDVARCTCGKGSGTKPDPEPTGRMVPRNLPQSEPGEVRCQNIPAAETEPFKSTMDELRARGYQVDPPEEFRPRFLRPMPHMAPLEAQLAACAPSRDRISGLERALRAYRDNEKRAGRVPGGGGA